MSRRDVSELDDVAANVRKCLVAGLDRILVVATNDQARAAIHRHLPRADHPAPRIVVLSAHEFMNAGQERLGL